MGNETSLAQKTKIEQSFYTFLEIVYLEVSDELKNSVSRKFISPNQNSVPWGRVPWGLAVQRGRGAVRYVNRLNVRLILKTQ